MVRCLHAPLFLTDICSKKRKQKCDKLQPCGTCMTRGEPEFCEYDEGSTPPPQHAYVAQSDFLILQARVARLEHELKLSVSSASGVHTGTTTKSPLSLLSHKETPRTHHSNTTTSTPAADVEPTIHAIERMGLNLFDLAKYTAGHPSTDAEDGDTGDSKGGENAVPVWPSIIDQGNAKRIIKTKWVRDMTEVMQAIPKKEVVDTLIAVIVRDLHMPGELGAGADEELLPGTDEKCGLACDDRDEREPGLTLRSLGHDRGGGDCRLRLWRSSIGIGTSEHGH